MDANRFFCAMHIAMSAQSPRGAVLLAAVQPAGSRRQTTPAWS